MVYYGILYCVYICIHICYIDMFLNMYTYGIQKNEYGLFIVALPNLPMIILYILSQMLTKWLVLEYKTTKLGHKYGVNVGQYSIH